MWKRARAWWLNAFQGTSNNTGSIRLQETAKDGTVWEIVNISTNVPGRLAHHHVLCEAQGPTTRSKRSIREESVVGSWRLLIDEAIL